MEYAIRRFRDDDAQALASIMGAAISYIGTRAYTQQQVDAWFARHHTPERYLERAAAGHTIFVATDPDDRPIAYTLLEADGHLDHLYCHPDHTRRGIAEKLLERSEQEARAIGCTRLYTEASDLARPAFERLGYTATHRREFEIAHGDHMVPIHNWAMEKLLA
ncbi:GNAT family N-acetyltransferase [Qipengyuania sp. RANM35]|uniref:GNAT family N-acetyltransferase n=1 Tax=Qipengyuania sp. RANM35 TaxID=3068635 RepID=UPI0034DB5289